MRVIGGPDLYSLQRGLSGLNTSLRGLAQAQLGDRLRLRAREQALADRAHAEERQDLLSRRAMAPELAQRGLSVPFAWGEQDPVLGALMARLPTSGRLMADAPSTGPDGAEMLALIAPQRPAPSALEAMGAQYDERRRSEELDAAIRRVRTMQPVPFLWNNAGSDAGPPTREMALSRSLRDQQEQAGDDIFHIADQAPLRYAPHPSSLLPYRALGKPPLPPPPPDPYKLELLGIGRGKVAEQERHNRAMEAAARQRNQAMRDRLDFVMKQGGQNDKIGVMRLAQADVENFNDALMDAMRLSKSDFAALTPEQIAGFIDTEAGRAVAERFTTYIDGKPYFIGDPAQAIDYRAKEYQQRLGGMGGQGDDASVRVSGAGAQGVAAAQGALQRKLADDQAADFRRRFQSADPGAGKQAVLDALLLELERAGIADPAERKRQALGIVAQ